MANGTELIVIGDSTEPAIAKMSIGGTVYSFRKKVRMSAELGHWYTMKVKNAKSGRWEEKKIITSKGYDHLRALMGIYITTPDTIFDDSGNEVGNPYVHRVKGLIDFVKYRVTGCGRGPAGNWAAVDLLFSYNFSAYLGSDIFNKAYKDDQLKSWASVVNDSTPCPDTCYRVAVSPGVALQVDLGNPAVYAILKEHKEKEKFAERNAYSMACRNVIRKLTGLYYVDDDETVTVTIWPQLDKDYRKIGEMVAVSKGGNVIIDGEVVEVEKDIADADEEDIVASEDADDNLEPADQEPVLERDDLRRMIRAAVSSLPDRWNDLKVQSALVQIGCDTVEDFSLNGTIAQMRDFLALIKG